MDKRQIKISFGNGEEEEFFVNENVDDSMLAEALAKLDMQVMDNIFGDADDDRINTDKDER